MALNEMRNYLRLKGSFRVVAQNRDGANAVRKAKEHQLKDTTAFI
jgi:hypothetical protein